MSTYIKSLDGLRAIAVIFVMLFHFKLLEFGWIGVQMFFVLSGFLITGILTREKENPISTYLGRFYWRRSLRIFPLYFLYLLLVSVIYFVVRQPENFPEKAIYLFTYTINFTRLSEAWSHSPLFTHLWSLSVEEQFYLVWPLIVYFFSKRSFKVIIVCLIFVSPIFRYMLALYWQSQGYDADTVGESVYWFTFSHIDAFAIGGAIAVFDVNTLLKRSISLFNLVLFLTLVIGFANLANTTNELGGYTSLGYPIAQLTNHQHVWSYSVLNILFGLLILNIVHHNKFTFLSNRYLVKVGQVSYGMYVFHWGVMSIYDKAFGQFLSKNIFSFTLYFMIVFLISSLSYYLFEKKFIALKDRKFTIDKKKYVNHPV